MVKNEQPFTEMEWEEEDDVPKQIPALKTARFFPFEYIDRENLQYQKYVQR